jgi:hypothetical protein
MGMVEIQDGKAGFDGNRTRLSAPGKCSSLEKRSRRRLAIEDVGKMPVSRSGVKLSEESQTQRTHHG